MKIHVAGEASLIIVFAGEASPEVSRKVQSAAVLLEQALADLLVDLTPSYASLLVIFDSVAASHRDVSKRIRSALMDFDCVVGDTGKRVEIPVYYSPESGPDLPVIAARTGLTQQQIVDIHLHCEYRVYAVGFAPGFAYLGQLDARIATPRLPTPRNSVPRGAVGIADRQTAVYPAPSPGGWNLIGLSPLRMFDPNAEPHMPVQVGDRVVFRSIGRETFFALGGELPGGEWR